MQIIVIRPEPGCHASVTDAREMGLDAQGHPMFAVRSLPWEAPQREEIDALLLGSANALRHAGDALSAYAGMPAYAVGEKTAEAARGADLQVIAAGETDLQDVLARLDPGHSRLLRIAGKQHVQIDPPEGVTIIERECYSSDPLPMSPALSAALRRPALVLLHSAIAARHFAQSCDGKGIDRSRVAIAAISPRAAQAAGDGWCEVQSAGKPNDGALLALAVDLCESLGHYDDDRKDMMQDTPEMSASGSYRQPRRSVKGQLLAALLAFVLGAALVGYLTWRGYLGPDLISAGAQDEDTQTAEARSRPSLSAPAAMTETEKIEAVGGVEARLAMLEDRFSRLNLQANAASGNAARAESLLIAFAARRMIDRGEPLTFLADQLQLRFANAQPRAVETIVDFGKAPVTIDQLSARLEALKPDLVGGSGEEDFWESTKRELSNIFTVRREPSTLMSADARYQRASVMLTAKRVPEAVAQVERLPGSQAASQWIADARRYDAAQKALDLIETTAMLDPSRLQDSDGNTVDQPSPLANPTPKPTPEPTSRPAPKPSA